MKVLHLFNELRFSGAELLLYSGAKQFLSAGEHVVLSTGEQIGDFGSALSEKGFRVEHLPFRKTPGFFVRLFEVVHSGKYDLVHLHPERGAFWNTIAIRTAGCPCVRTIHSEFLFEGGLRFRRRLQRQIAAKLGVRYVACSPSVARNEAARFNIRPVVIENWIDPSRVYRTSEHRRREARRRLSIPENAFVIVSIGNYGPAKNQEAIVEAIRQSRSSSNIIYLHCGAGAERLKHAVDQRVFSQIRFLGVVRDIADILAASDVFVSTSFHEGGPIALLEAAAAGILCITTRVGLAETFAGCRGIFFIEPEARSLSHAIDSLTGLSVEERLELGTGLSDRVMNTFVPDIGVQKYIALYSDILSARTH